MTKSSLVDKLKKLFFPEGVPIRSMIYLAGLFSVALLHTIGSESFYNAKEKDKNKIILWEKEISELNLEYNVIQNEIDEFSENAESKYVNYKLIKDIHKKLEIEEKLHFMNQSKNNGLTYQEAIIKYEAKYN